MTKLITRRHAAGGLILGAGGLLSGCDALGDNQTFRKVIYSGDGINRRLQRLVSDRGALAREYSPREMSPRFRTNGTRDPTNPEYTALAKGGFANWKLTVDGLVERPLAISLNQLRSMPARSQITRHDCVEGWSAIGKWTGPRLSLILDMARLKPAARYIIFHCADAYRGGTEPYYESIDLIDSFHPQTILAWAMNDSPLSIGHGAPVRLRVERQLGYKHAKYVMRIEAVASLDHIRGGKGGLWEDMAGYDWYAGI
ncbi:molybdopterin-dependent oxidoreductase [Stakelama sp. CBK3Z-3]|uniref:Molybdopterin-dependent oxidoreductase n=1 Tax=Stakelama flava TaxID=2860338 RepID=A0ABS6XM28_9SPHN|nr:molybdopterin-dependent oxidoreductase [Stakelama flava]MBW4331263.1 molybdopterin-dependent oxidoreductase [Stakelama flava]